MHGILDFAGLASHPPVPLTIVFCCQMKSSHICTPSSPVFWWRGLSYDHCTHSWTEGGKGGYPCKDGDLGPSVAWKVMLSWPARGCFLSDRTRTPAVQSPVIIHTSTPKPMPTSGSDGRISYTASDCPLDISLECCQVKSCPRLCLKSGARGQYQHRLHLNLRSPSSLAYFI